MKKILLIGIAVSLLLCLTGCGSNSPDAGSSDTSKSSSVISSKGDSDSSSEDISFDTNDKSKKTYKQHVQELWDKTKVLFREDAKKGLSDKEYMKRGDQISQAWVNLQVHISISSNGHDEKVEDTKKSVLGNMTANVIGEIDKIYGNRSKNDTEEERAKRRAKANLDYIIKKYDDKLAKLTSIN